MTTDCLTDRAYVTSGDQKLHDAVVGLAVTVMLIIPAVLVAFTVL